VPGGVGKIYFPDFDFGGGAQHQVAARRMDFTQFYFERGPAAVHLATMGIVFALALA